MKNKKSIISIIVIILIAVCGICAYKVFGFVMDKYHFIRNEIVEINENTKDNFSQYEFDYSWMKNIIYVAHAFGGKGSKTYTNALEAFEYNYDLVHRVFEVDFDLTTDNKIICSHDEEYWR